MQDKTTRLVENLKMSFNSRKAKQQYIEKQIESRKKTVVEKKEHLKDLKEAREIVVLVGKLSIETLKQCIESLITTAIRDVYQMPYKFILQFETKAGKNVCQPLVQEGDNEPEIPKDEMGVGILDVISIAWRFIMWSIEVPRSRAFFYLDEPLRHVGQGDILLRAGMMLRKIANRLEVQLLVNSHHPDIIVIADRVWRTTKRNRETKIVLLSEEKKIKKVNLL
jgi:hypothetical protein